MTKVFQHDCPHCGTKAVAFNMHEQIKIPDDGIGWHVFAVCGHCGWGTVAFFLAPPGQNPLAHYQPGGHQINLLRVWPDPTGGKIPEHLEKPVERYFSQGVDGLGGNYDSAGAMFRKALDVGLKIKFPDITGKLFTRIETAVEQGSLTAELGEWAHHIRLEGNDAVHDDDPYTEQEARDLHVFTDLVMRYLFTLPGMLEARREAPGFGEEQPDG